MYVDTTNNTLLLMVPRETHTGKWRAYYYDQTTHESATVESKERQDEHAHWDDIHHEDMEYFHKHAKRYLKRPKPHSKLGHDATHAKAIDWAMSSHEEVFAHRFKDHAEHAQAPATPIKPTVRQRSIQQSKHQLQEAIPHQTQTASPKQPPVQHPAEQDRRRSERTYRRPKRFDGYL